MAVHNDNLVKKVQSEHICYQKKGGEALEL
jgi:hypothetical protein